MDEVDIAAEVMERAAELRRLRGLARESRTTRFYDLCRNCGEALCVVDLRRAGFCGIECRDEHDLRGRMAAINGRRPS